MQGLWEPYDVGGTAGSVQTPAPMAQDASEAARVTGPQGLYAFRGPLSKGRQGVREGGRACDARLLALDDNPLDALNERVAICTVDGGLGQEEAEAIAWREVEGQPVQPVDAHVGPRAAAVPEGNEVAKAGDVSPHGPTSAATGDTKGYQ